MSATAGGRPVLLLGGSGLLGSAVLRALELRRVAVLAPGRDELDLANPQAAHAAVVGLRPGRVINAAAFSDVTRAELAEQRDRVYAVNARGPEAVARACAALGCPLAHVSTDYVFDGESEVPYREHDRVGPLQVYGRSKLQGERRVAAACPQVLIVRTSTLFGPGGPRRLHYVDAILERAAAGSTVEVVETPEASPGYTPDVAEALLQLCEVEARGLVHVANDGSCSRLELARAAVERAGRGAAVRVVGRPEPRDGVRRPRYSVLDTRRFRELCGHGLRAWEVALEAYLAARRAV